MRLSKSYSRNQDKKTIEMRGFLSQIPFIKPAIMDSRQAEIFNVMS
jgi:hypothetical protein